MFDPKIGQLIVIKHPVLNEGQKYYAVITNIFTNKLVEITFCSNDWIMKVDTDFLKLVSDVD